MADTFGLKIAVEGEKEFNSAIREINNSYKVLASEMQLVTAQFDKNDQSLAAVTARNTVFNKEIDLQKEKISTLEKALANASASYEANDKRTLSWQTQLNKAQATLVEMERGLSTNNAELERHTSGMAAAEQREAEFKKSIEAIGASFTVLGTEIALVDSQYDKNDRSLEAVTARNTALNKEIDLQKEKISTLEQALSHASDTFGENDKRTQEWQMQLNKAKIELNNLERGIVASNAELERHTSGVAAAEQKDADFKKAVENISQSLKSLSSETTDLSGKYGENANATKTLKERKAELSKEIKLQEEKISLLKQALDNSTASFGENDQRTQAWKEQLNGAQASLKDMEGELSGNKASLIAWESALKSAGEAVKFAAKAIASMASAAAKAAVDAGKDMLKLAEAAANTGREVNLTSQKLGMSREGFQEWSFILKKSGTSADVLGTGMKTLQKTLGGMTEDGDKSSEAFKAIGLSFEEVKGKSPEEALNMTIKALQDLPTGADRTTAALKLFGKGAMELQPLLNKTSEETEGLRKRAHELGLVMSDEQIDNAAKFKSAMGKINDTVSGVKLQFGSELLPVFADTMAAFLDLATGAEKGAENIKKAADSITKALTETIPKFVEKGAQMISALVTGIASALPSVAAAVTEAIPLMISALAPILPAMLRTFAELIPGVINAISETLPALTGVVMDVISTVITVIADMLPMAITAGTKLFMGLADAITTVIPVLIQKVPEIVTQIVSALIGAAPMLLEAAATIVSTLADGLGNAVPILKPIMTVVSGLMDALKALTPVILAAAAGFAAFQIVMTVANAIKAMTAATTAQTLATALHTAVTTVWSAITGTATAVAAAFNAALAANPIGLIIAGIAALVVGIAALIVIMNKETAEQKALKKNTEDLVEANKKLVDATKESQKSYEEKTASMAQEAGVAKSLADDIAGLSRVENKSAEQKQQLAAYVSMLNEAMGESVVEYDAETDSMSRNVDEIYNIVAARQEEAKAQAARERAVEIAKEQMAVEDQLAQVAKQRAALDQAVADGVYKKGEADKKYKEQLAEINASEAELVQRQSELADSFDSATKTIEESSEKQRKANEALAASQVKVVDAMEGAKKAQKEIADKRAAAEQELTDKLIIEANKQGLTLDEYKEKIKEIEKEEKKAYEEREKAIEKYSETTQNAFGKIKVESGVSVKTLQENLEYNQKKFKEWSDNIAALAKRGIDEGLLEKLKAAGPESSETVANLIKATDDQLTKLSDTYAKGGKQATEAIDRELGLFDGENAGKTVNEDIAKGIEQTEPVISAAEKLIKDTKAAAEASVTAAKFDELGTQMTDGMARGIVYGESRVKEALLHVVASAKTSVESAYRIESPSKVFEEEIGKNIALGTAAGIDKNADKAAQAAEKMAKEIFDNAKLWIEGYQYSTQYAADEELKMWEILGERYKGVTKEKVEIDKNIAKLRENIRKEQEQKEKDAYEHTKLMIKDYQNSAEYSIGAEIKMWENLAAKHTEVSKEKIEIESTINKLREQQAKDRQAAEEKALKARESAEKQAFESAKKWIENRKKTGKLTLAEELAAWERVQSRYAEGSEQRKQLDEQVFAAKKRIADEEKKLNAEIIKAEENYTKAVDSRAKTIYNSFGMFDELKKKEAEVSGKTLTDNLSAQVDELKNWAENLEALSKKGVDGGLIAELKAMGPKANAEIAALSKMSEPELEKYQALWKEKAALARTQAVSELKGLRADTKAQIKGLKDDLAALSPATVSEAAIAPATEAIDALTAVVPQLVGTVNAAFAEQKPELSGQGAKNTGYIAEGMVSGIPDITKSVGKIIESVGKQFKSGTGLFVEIGRNIMRGIGEGVTSLSGWLNDLLRDYIDRMVESVEERLQISSPSRVFAGIGGNMALSLGGGFADNMSKVNRDIQNAVAIPKVTRADRIMDFLGGLNSVESGGRPPGGNIANTFNFYTETVTPSKLAKAGQKASQRMLRDIGW